MALLTDGNPNDTQALQAYETQIVSVASVEGIDLNAKLTLATAEISEDVIDLLLDHTLTWGTPWIAQGDLRRKLGVSDVVVTAALQRWHALHTLAIVYRDAFNNQLNDRYKAKWDEYRALAWSGREKTIKYGIGLVLSPVPEAPAPSFGVTESTALAATYYVQATWVSGSGQESEPSEMTNYTTPNGGSLVVSMANAPSVATGWNVYIGLTSGGLMLQNSAPLGVSEAFTVPVNGLVSGAAPGNGQPADYYVTGGQMLRRG